ncbi:transglycosylase [Specibacter sp. RAF43]|uniref:aggregation-promoting factor C-terminal-like domain-containing protein n=1 Tax=Specibacter sp. RAF43 TaxID=3233057 RepID=UPI003F995C91
MSTQHHNHGRRRAETTPRKESRRRMPRTGGPARRMAIVAVAGVLLAGGGLGQAAGSSGPGGLPSDLFAAGAGSTTAAVSAPSDAPIDFARVLVSSSTELRSNVPDVAAAADSVTPVGAAGGPVNDPAGAQKYAATQLAAHGWGQDQMSCLVQLWNRESDWTTTAENPSSLAYGIAQSLPASKMDSVAGDWRTNYQTQIKWGLTYIADRYGSPCAVWDHEVSIGWY